MTERAAIDHRPMDPREAPGPVRAANGEVDARLPVRALAAKGQLLNARPSVVAQRALSGKLTQRRAQTRLTQPRLVPPGQGSSQAAVQRAIIVSGGGENFSHIVTEFSKFAKAQGGEAWAMLEWFWHGKNNTLEVKSVSELDDALGYTDCRIGGKEAHTLTDKDWSTLSRDVPVTITVSILNDKGAVTHNDARQYYTILHEMMVHAHPFYLKMKKVRAGTGPKSKALAGYHDGRDKMGAHAEHQHLLHGTNEPFQALYQHMVSELLKGLFGEVPETLKGMSVTTFIETHQHDITIQYIEEASAKYKGAQRVIKAILARLEEEKSLKLSKEAITKRYRYYIEKLTEVKEVVRQVWGDYHQAYTIHTHDYKPPDHREPEIPREGVGGISAEVLAQLPYFNPNAWSQKEQDWMAEKVREVSDIHGRVETYIAQFRKALGDTK